ncbi:MAG TPA: amidohydrolase family protein [Anaerolineaceae bacterium]|nr:amidohydrolase family protein [Anaerolineaceae bacterium]
MFDLAIMGGCIYQHQTWTSTNAYIQAGKIAAITDKYLESTKKIDAQGLRVIPGLIDAHVHLAMNSGQFMTADDFETGSQAAAFGGVTTLIDFLDEQNEPAAMQKEFLRKRRLAKNCHIDFGLHAAITDLNDFSAEEMAQIALKIGSPTIKLYTTYKPFSYSSPETVAKMVKRSGRGDILILCHAEKDELLQFDQDSISFLAENRPALAENEEIREIAQLVRHYRGWAYIVHTSCGSSIEMLKAIDADLLNSHLFLEGCPQYFLFNSTIYQGDQASLYSLTPPLRTEAEKQLLSQNWRNLAVFSTDHCPFPLLAKSGDRISQLPMGIGGLERSFGLMYSLFGDAVINRLTCNPAILHGLYPRKGVIRVGSDADFCIFHDTEFHPYGTEHSACDYSIYADIPVNSQIDYVISSGEVIINRGVFAGTRGNFQPRSLDCRLFNKYIEFESRSL